MVKYILFGDLKCEQLIFLVLYFGVNYEIHLLYCFRLKKHVNIPLTFLPMSVTDFCYPFLYMTLKSCLQLEEKEIP